jgi:hypothetical protein
MASALLVVMVLGSIICLFVMYYLSLIQQQNTLSVRSQAWNIAIAVTEAGIEEGMQALNSDLNLSTSDGWYPDGTGMYCRTNQDTALGGNWYTIAVRKDYPVAFQHEVTCRAYVTLPALALNSPSAFFAAYGVDLGPGVVCRAVRVRCHGNPLFLAAMVAKHKIDLKGNGILTDSFDSESLWKSYFGQYDATKFTPGDKGDIASNDGVVSTISVQNANVYGKAHVGAEGTVAVGSQGAVGSHAWQNAGNKGFQDGWVNQDANFTFPETSLPYSSGLPLGDPETIVTVTYDYLRTLTNSTAYPTPPPWSGVITNIVSYSTNYYGTPPPSPLPVGTRTFYTHPNLAGCIHLNYYWPNFSYTYNLYTTNAIYSTNTYDHVIREGDYYTADDLHGSTIVLGNAQLVLPTGLSMSGNDQITIAPGGSLKMYVDGSACTVGGNGVLNQSGYAWNFMLQCTPNVKNFTFNGNGEFIGVLVAPEANMTMNGGGKSNNDFIGSLMMNSVGMNGHFSFHYDEALSRKFPNPRLLITAWNEIK